MPFSFRFYIFKRLHPKTIDVILNGLFTSRATYHFNPLAPNTYFIIVGVSNTNYIKDYGESLKMLCMGRSRDV